MRSNSRAMSSFGLRPVTSNTCSAVHLMILGAGIVILVDAVTEAHQLTVAFFDLLNVCGDVLLRTNLVEHSQHFFICSAVQWPCQSGGGRGGGQVRIGMRRFRPTHGVGAAILFVIRVQDEQYI